MADERDADKKFSSNSSIVSERGLSPPRIASMQLNYIKVQRLIDIDSKQSIPLVSKREISLQPTNA